MRKLGKTDLNIKRVGFGGLPIQRVSQEECDKIIDEIIKHDVNFIDTARGYTISEEYIGNSIKDKNYKFIIATKSMNRDYKGMKKDIDISLNNLKCEKIDLYQMHNVKMEEYDSLFEENMAYKALLEVKEEGKIKHIGITSHNVDVIKKAIEDEKFDTIQIPYNMVETQGEEVLKLANDKNIGTIIMKPLAGGALTDAKLALKYILSKEYIDVVIPGMDKVEQIEENVSILKDEIKLTEDEIDCINKIKKELGNSFCRRCEYCMPCVENINIPLQFLLEGYYTRYDLKEWSTNRYKSLEKKASDCIECGACEEKCPYDLNIREMLKNAAKVLS
ncbi:MAG: aldo/keto reductase [Tepidibacter sp.]|jgi:predicted aldo/keto reductase-like oxidoreductase|uniref:aldo/keto reductase n=1 Tax=Tepidibacter sp. TaxID=2529387 RepID=UPI0025DC1380|nr:aldo/keto reductase [Tepidibacter sp.]MCT4508755.1 aldo/keto reductase [Tepidibacter sp.]